MQTQSNNTMLITVKRHTNSIIPSLSTKSCKAKINIKLAYWTCSFRQYRIVVYDFILYFDFVYGSSV